MTDNEIIKALECCSSNATGNEYCKDCPYNIYEYCGEESAKDTLDLINRQKAEIERLKPFEKKVLNIVIDNLKEIEMSKFEAYKEIIAKLKEHLCNYDLPDYHSFRAVDEDTIDEVLKEMVGN